MGRKNFFLIFFNFSEKNMIEYIIVIQDVKTHKKIKL